MKQICTRCVMDTEGDPYIKFNEDGTCNYCTSALERKKNVYFPDAKGKTMLKSLCDKLIREGKGKRYDCIMGVSGGLDSSYLLYLGKKWGLRILAVHIDDGFDTEISKSNIDKLVKTTQVDYRVVTPDKEQFAALTKAYILAGVPNLAIPQDNLIFAYMYKLARKYKIRHFLSGTNFALECVLQTGNTYRAFDVTNIKSIHEKFGKKPINKLHFLSDYRRFVDQKILKIETHKPLDYIDYNRDRAFEELSAFCNFRYYGSKHLENILTKFIQLYWLYNKFGVDKRKSHLSSMVVSGQMTREQALEELKKPLYDEGDIQSDIKTVCSSLGLTRQELEDIMLQPSKQHEEYGIDKFYPIFKKLFYK